MPETSLIALLLIIVSVCLTVLTITLLWAIRDLRRVLQSVSRRIPLWDGTLRIVQEAGEQARQVFLRANTTTAYLESASRRISDVVLTVIDPIQRIADKAKGFLGGGRENGAREEPRHRKRRKSNERRKLR